MCSLQDVRYFDEAWVGGRTYYRISLVDHTGRRTEERTPRGEQYPKRPFIYPCNKPDYLCYACGVWFYHFQWEDVKAHIQRYEEIYQFMTRLLREEIDRTKSKQ